MTPKTLLLLCLIPFLALGPACRRKSGRARVEPTASPKPGEPQIAVTALERMSTVYERATAGGYGPAPSSRSDVPFKARLGNEFVVLRLEVKAPAGVEEFKIEGPQVSDQDGKQYPSIAESMTLSKLGGGVKKADLAFEIPKGAQLKTLKFGDYSFDVSKL